MSYQVELSKLRQLLHRNQQDGCMDCWHHTFRGPRKHKNIIFSSNKLNTTKCADVVLILEPKFHVDLNFWKAERRIYLDNLLFFHQVLTNNRACHPSCQNESAGGCQRQLLLLLHRPSKGFSCRLPLVSSLLWIQMESQTKNQTNKNTVSH